MKAKQFIPGQFGFTLIELLVVIAVVAILAVLLLPALAAARRRATLTQCQNNFHQVYVACMAYANDYHDYFPTFRRFTAPADANYVSYPSDSGWIVFDKLLPPNLPVKPGIQSSILFQNLGHLYETGMIGDGRILDCPGYPDTSLFSAAHYSKPSFMSTDTDGWVRSSMLFNPEVVNPVPPMDTSRSFPKSSSIIPRRLFGMDGLQTFIYSSLPGAYTIFPSSVQFNPSIFPHYPSHGFNVLFADGSVKYVQSVEAFNFTRWLDDGDDTYSKFFQMLEAAQ